MAEWDLSDAILNALACAGCLTYFAYAWLERKGNDLAKTAVFLFGVLAALLGVRAVQWLTHGELLGRLVDAFAALVPIAVTLFVEQLLRRHSPLWLKAAALGLSATFFFWNLASDSPLGRPSDPWFLAGLLLVLAGNGWQLRAPAHAELSRNERRRARALLIAALVAVPLVATDFRTTLGLLPLRLGAMSALLFTYILVFFSASERYLVELFGRLAAIALAGVLLATVFGVLQSGSGLDLWRATLHGLPVAVAWITLTAIYMQIIEMRQETRAQSFPRWLLHARLDSGEGLVSSLRHLPFAADHLVLEAHDLEGYDSGRLFDLAGERREPFSLPEARTWLGAADHTRVEVAEQLVDLLERHGMTHAIFVQRTPPRALLFNLPTGPQATLGAARLGVIQRLARRLAEG